MVRGLVSVITVCRNAGPGLEETLQSVVAQYHVGVECVVQNGDPSDSTPRELADRWPEFVRLESRMDCGIYNAMNLALQRARGEFVLFLNAGDALLEPDSLGNWVAELTGAPHASVSICAYLNLFDGTVTYYPRRLSRLFLYRNNFCHQAQLWRRSSLDAYGPFDESYRVLADRALLLRAVANGAVAMISRHVRIAYKDNGFSAAEGNQPLKRHEHERTKREFFRRRERFWYSVFEAVTIKPLRMWFWNNYRGTPLFRSYKRAVNLINSR